MFFFFVKVCCLKIHVHFHCMIFFWVGVFRVYGWIWLFVWLLNVSDTVWFRDSFKLVT